jgi:hypothetical protein
MKLQLGPESVSRTPNLGTESCLPQVSYGGTAGLPQNGFGRRAVDPERLVFIGFLSSPASHRSIASWRLWMAKGLMIIPRLMEIGLKSRYCAPQIGQIDSSGHFTSFVATGTDPSGRHLGQPGIPQMHGPLRS